MQIELVNYFQGLICNKLIVLSKIPFQTNVQL